MSVHVFLGKHTNVPYAELKQYHIKLNQVEWKLGLINLFP